MWEKHASHLFTFSVTSKCLNMLHLVHTLHNIWQIRGMRTDWLSNQPTNQPATSMAYSPSQDASRSSASQHIPCILCNLRLISLFTRAHHLSLYWLISVKFMLSHPTSLRFTLILSSHLPLGLPSGLFLSGFPTKILCQGFLLTQHVCHMPQHSPPWFSHLTNNMLHYAQWA